MNIATAFLTQHWEELELEGVTAPERLSWLVLTPRFPASSHILFIVFSEASSEPLLVMKISRVPGEDAALDREAKNLRAVHAATEDLHATIPRVIAFSAESGNSMLVESALVGVQMDPAFVRQRTKWSAEAVHTWITNLHKQTQVSSYARPGWFSDLVDSSLVRIESAVRLSKDERNLLTRVRDIVSALRHAKFPLVFAHGDLSDPNILALRKGGIGVVDWEMAEAEGLPGADLFFFLNYVATARHPWVKTDDVDQFQRAFFSENSWTRKYISRYSEELGVSKELLAPLFVLCFTRYLSGLIARMQGTSEVLDAETSAWLRTDRAYVLWREAVQNYDQLALA